VTNDAKGAVEDNTFQFSILEDEKSAHAQQQDVIKARMESFQMLKEGNGEENNDPKDHIKNLVSFFRKIKADTSLLAALPLALGRKKDERSAFDALAVNQLEKMLEEKLCEIAAQIVTNDSAIAEKAALKGTAEAAFSSALKKQRLAAEDLLEVRAERKQLTADLQQKQEAVVEQEFEVKALSSEHKERMVFLKAHQDFQNTLVELLERCAPVPEVVIEEPEQQVAEVTMEAVPDTVEEVAI